MWCCMHCASYEFVELLSCYTDNLETNYNQSISKIPANHISFKQPLWGKLDVPPHCFRRTEQLNVFSGIAAWRSKPHGRFEPRV
jgi:hypothetical protein